MIFSYIRWKVKKLVRTQLTDDVVVSFMVSNSSFRDKLVAELTLYRWYAAIVKNSFILLLILGQCIYFLLYLILI